MYADPTATKYLVKAKMTADGVVEKPDVVGAIFGQTEGLLGDDLDLRDLQKTGRIGRIEVEVTSKGGRSEGSVIMSSSLDQVETVLLASALETVDRVGPCRANIKVTSIEDVRITKREMVADRARELLKELITQSKGTSSDLIDDIRKTLQVEEIVSFGKDKCPAGPNVKDSEAIIVVEGRSDVINCLKSGIKNAIAVEGTDIPETVQELSRERVVTAFVDGDRGGELILKELFQVAEVDFVARAPRAHEVEELTQKQLVKCLRNKIPADQYMEMNNITVDDEEEEKKERPKRESKSEERKSEERRNGRSEERQQRRERFDPETAERFKKKETREPKEEEKPKESDDDDKQDKDEKSTRTLKGKRTSKRPEKVLTEEQQFYKDVLAELASTHNAKILDGEKNVIKEVPVKNLADILKEDSEGVASIVFDGVISQRLIDVSEENGIGIVVATRKGKISKLPADIIIWSKDDFY
ncbi:MAG: DNA primase DnaG [Candidatus Methanomethylophilaceae archaeon]|jgi:DNA primase